MHLKYWQLGYPNNLKILPDIVKSDKTEKITYLEWLFTSVNKLMSL